MFYCKTQFTILGRTFVLIHSWYCVYRRDRWQHKRDRIFFFGGGSLLDKVQSTFLGAISFNVFWINSAILEIGWSRPNSKSSGWVYSCFAMQPIN